ncbi:DUF6644 family protein [Pararhizobium sp. DWP3-4]|uniref:DUF6644 family protein n=1 Tax=Pararhizobium sp. DWP3-4 TaxID=2804565 RepID=UPI003CE79232
MSGPDLLAWIGAWPVAVAMRGSATLYLFVNAAHILSIGLLVGAILPLDLRLLGFFGHVPVSVVGPLLSRMAATGLLLAIVTGFCLFSVRPLAYATNVAFLTKVALLCFGVANALLLHLHPHWRAAIADGLLSIRVRLAAFVSLAVWIGAVLAGRWIGFL